MPIEMDGGRRAGEWGRSGSEHGLSVGKGDAGLNYGLRIALINNMPDSALEDTENQFFELIEHAAGHQRVHIQLFSLPDIPRGERGVERLACFYRDIDDLWNSQFDGIIVTGTEPRQPNLRDEPYWPGFVELMEWAERHTHSAVMSCLAAHGSVLQGDGIERHPLPHKQSGVFTYRTSDHALTRGIGESLCFPHSRWNEVRCPDLVAAGYQVLTQSPDFGVDSFVKRRKRSLFVHFQGHPEYGPLTLMKEYRRDIKRFVRKEREAYPTMPSGYFDDCSTRLMQEFERDVLAAPGEEQMAFFPEAVAIERLEHRWRSSAISIYANWLRFLELQKQEDATIVPFTSRYPENPREQIA